MPSAIHLEDIVRQLVPRINSAHPVVRTRATFLFASAAFVALAAGLFGVVTLGNNKLFIQIGLIVLIACCLLCMALARRGWVAVGGNLLCLLIISFITFLGKPTAIVMGTEGYLYLMPLLIAAIVLGSRAVPFYALGSSICILGVAWVYDLVLIKASVLIVIMLLVSGMLLFLLLRQWERLFNQYLRREHKLELLSSSLERQVAERTRHLDHAVAELAAQQQELVTAKQVADQATQAKAAFLADMSHEIRNPLSAIISAAQTLHYYGPLADKQQRYQQIMVEKSQHLLTLVNHLLDLEKIAAGRLELMGEPTDLETIPNRGLGVAIPQK